MLSNIRSLPHSPSSPSAAPEQARSEPQRAASQPAPGSDSGLPSRMNSLRAADAEVAANTTSLAPRNQTLKTLGKHTWGAVKHGAASALYSAGRAAHSLTASLSGKDSLLQHAHRLAGETARPLARTEWKMAKAHLQAVRSAAGGTSARAGKYDASAIAEKLSSLKEEKAAAQDTRKGRLGQGVVEPFSAARTTKPAPSAPASPNAAAALARKLHGPATHQATLSVRYAVAGMYHKLKEGSHFLSAKALAGQPIVARAHRQAQESHHNKAAQSFHKAVTETASSWDIRFTVSIYGRTQPREQPGGSAAGKVHPTPAAVDPAQKREA